MCGGDGSVGWVLSEIDKLNLHKQASASFLLPRRPDRINEVCVESKTKTNISKYCFINCVLTE